MSPGAARARLAARVESRTGEFAELCRSLVRVDSTNPPVSEAEPGVGEAETLRRITVNTGRLERGIGVNTIPARATALCDIRIPPGVTVERVRAELAAAVDPLPHVSWRILESPEPS